MPTPTPARAFLLFLFVSAVVFLRPPSTNFIYDEQEALLGNPYLAGHVPVHDVLEVDFWGRRPEATIGSYRPLPNVLWRPLAFTLEYSTPWFFHLLNLVVHALTATCLAFAVGRHFERGRRDARELIVWGVGLLFTCHAVSTEAVCSVVGLADLLVGLFSALLLLSLWSFRATTLRLAPLYFLLVFGSCLLGLFSKETMLGTLCALPLVVAFGPQFGASDWRQKVLRFGVATGAAVSALVAQVVVRRSFFPAKRAELEPLLLDGTLGRAIEPFFHWLSQPVLPKDELNNPLLGATSLERLMTCAEMFAEQFLQHVWPFGLSSEHSFPRQAVSHGGAGAIFGLLLFLGLLAVVVWALFHVFWRRGLSPEGMLLGLGCGWYLVTYLPVSNLIVLLPTIRADRLLYPPTLGWIIALSAVFSFVARRPHRLALVSVGAFLLTHAFFGRLHALDYKSDVSFWRAAVRGSPPSAKSHLNLGVMLGARGDHEARLFHSRRAVALAPDWPMGQIYLADTLCRMGRMEEAMKVYLPALARVPNQKALTALSLQCIWERGAFEENKHHLSDLAAVHPETWLDYFVYRLRTDGTEQGGIPPEYRPRKYNARVAPK